MAGRSISISNFLKGIPVYWKVAASAWLSRAAVLSIRLFSLPLLLSYLGIDEFAAFSVLISLEAWFFLGDFGMGPSIQNHLSEARVKQVSVETIYAAGAQIILILLVFFLGSIAFFHHQLEQFLQVPAGSVGIVGTLFLFQAAGSVGYRVLYALHQGYWIHVCQGIGGVLSLAAVASVTLWYSGVHKLSAALVAVNFFPALIAVGMFCYLFCNYKIFRFLHWKNYQTLLKQGASFWTFSAWSAAGLSVDYLVLSKTLSSADISSYHILSKPFLSCLFLYNALMLALWPQCSENSALKDWNEISKMIRKKLFIGLSLMCVATAIILFFAKPVTMVIFRSQELNFPVSTIVLFGVYMLLRVISDTYAMVFQSMNRLKVIFVFLPLQVILIIIGEWMLSRIWGLNGILWALIGGFSLTMVWWLPFNFRRLAMRAA